MNLSPTRLDKLELENFRCFSSITVNFHEKLTVIVAPNGGGKTSVLDAIAIALWPFPCTMQLKNSSPGFDPGDLRRVRSRLGGMQTLSPVTVKSSAFIHGNDAPLAWQRFRRSAAKGTRTSPKGAAPLQEAASRMWYQNVKFTKEESNFIPTYSLLAYYGTGRLWDESRLTYGKLYHNKADTSRESGYEDSLSPKSSYKSFVDWFGRYSNEAKGEKDSEKPSLHKPSEKLRALTAAVDTLLKPTGWHSLSWDFAEKRPVATHPEHGILPVDLLSDGLRNTIGLTSDIAHRCARINPQFGVDAAILTPGIVLIDEVDMHLHPEWQQLVLKAFQDAFPLIQFIVTTHSPQVVSTVPSECIRILRDGQVFASPPGTDGAEAQRILEDVFQVKPRPDTEHAKELNEYLRLVDDRKWDSSLALQLRSKLDLWSQGQEPRLEEADLQIENFKWEAGQ
jgi:predicted ATP-binding protein involved in virulence